MVEFDGLREKTEVLTMANDTDPCAACISEDRRALEILAGWAVCPPNMGDGCYVSEEQCRRCKIESARAQARKEMEK